VLVVEDETEQPPMEMTAIIVALLAAAEGLVVLSAFGLRSAAAHRQRLPAAGAQDRRRRRGRQGA
jgi:hypothetical protein